MADLCFDYLTVTIKPTVDNQNVTVQQMVELFTNCFRLNDYLNNFIVCGSSRFYASVARYNDIQLKICSQDRLYSQGLCIEMSGNGFRHWLKMLPFDIKFIDVMRDFRALSVCGFKCNVSRFDVALDDIARGVEKPILHLSTISRKWSGHEFCSRSRASSDETNRSFEDGSFFKVGKLSVNKVKGVEGRTIYFGNRKSSLYVRFYDKAAEQRQKGFPVDSDILSWIRCEYEFHNARAIAVLNLFIDNSYEEFVKKFKQIVMGHLRFINLDDSNRSRCSTCAWWVAFLDTVGGEKLASAGTHTVQFRKSYEWIKRSVLPTLWAILSCIGERNIVSFIRDGRDNIGFRQVQLMEDYLDSDSFNADCPNLWFDLMVADADDALKRLKQDSIYINYIPAELDKREWLQMAFAV